MSQAIFDKVKARDPDQKEFLQAVEEVLTTLEPVLKKRPELIPVVERLCEPERQILFRVPWFDDKGNIQVNRGYRVQFSSAIGPYKGGLRLHPTVNLSIIKFLGFEQIFKNSLTTLPIGGGKGGSDFNPKGKSENETMRFCQSFITELYRHIGPDTDVPAGDIGCSPREIGWMYGQYRRLSNTSVGILTGKGLSYGGSLIRPESTGYGTVYFGLEILKDKGEDFKGKRVVVSGSGNVSTFAIKKLLELGAVPITASDSTGFVYEKDGFTNETLEHLIDVKVVKRGTLKDYNSGQYFEGKRPWGVDAKYDVAIPGATQNEIELEDAKDLVKAGCKIVLEGANMPSTSDAIEYYHKNKVEFGCAKAANAGGVAVSALEMAQNSARLSWTSEEVDNKLKGIMASIYRASKDAAEEYSTTLQGGANIAGFLKVAEAMQAQGAV
ncbi:hypothetical protein WJX73_001208 [Symbiochloris irregularis]|uniref:Glutamate dehydrogenase n=1 Tax=Symbiochloris irregularis TaxID=706552 RepID=A0AAW1PMN4_9CHLO